MSGISCVAWAGWGFWHGHVGMGVVNALWLVPVAAELAVVFAMKPVSWRTGWLIPAWTSVLAVSALVSWMTVSRLDVLGFVIALSGVLWLTPAIIEVYRSPSIEGVSLPSWLVSGGSAAMWGVYGFVGGAWVPLLFAVLQIAGIVAVVARIFFVRTRAVSV